MTLVSALVVFGLLVIASGFVLAVLRRALTVDREIDATVRVLLWRVEVRVGSGPVPHEQTEGPTPGAWCSECGRLGRPDRAGSHG